MTHFYILQRYGKAIFLATAAIVVAVFLLVSNNLIEDLAAQERERMEIWADATKELVKEMEPDTSATGEASMNIDVDFLLSIIERNTTIPVLLTNEEGQILQHRNFALPEPIDSLNPLELSAANEQYLNNKLKDLEHSANVIHITIAPGADQNLYYEDSTILKRLSYYPYVQLLVMLVFIAVVYFAVLSTKKAEQNKVWVGLSKETAHQLGTPISSLMAWMEILPDMGVDSDTVGEMNKDVQRLSTIASRFSKIGSVPQLEAVNINTIVEHASEYMSRRISSRVDMSVDLTHVGANDRSMWVKASEPLLEWVMENLIKNAVDAMAGHGSISITTGYARTDRSVYVEVSDTGKGIARKNFKSVFNPGYTTKKRGWGLGLTLAKRIIEQYHHGRIYVKASTPGVGTTFRIELPTADSAKKEK